MYWAVHAALASASYKSSQSEITTEINLLPFMPHHLGDLENQVIEAETESSAFKPAFFVSIVHSLKEIVISIRGTQNSSDAVTDADFSCVIFDLSSGGGPSGHAHSGFVKSASYILGKVLGNLLPILSNPQHPASSYSIVLVGHSLGGATASLLCLMLKFHTLTDFFSQRDIRAIAYGPPPCFSFPILKTSNNYITTFVHEKDLVPRLSKVIDLFGSATRKVAGKTANSLQKLVSSVDASAPGIYGFVKGFVLHAASRALHNFSKSEKISIFLPGLIYHLTNNNLEVRSYEYFTTPEESVGRIEDHFLANYIAAFNWLLEHERK
eukprot:TRINITY_DN1888_c0_g1_i1.p1 TRINITY_DN1888_c0_g1~~TRINITY_DN1888_c0_g1_i1.p1  ORF type:complete len:362 (-),score=119.40 TRINITY_DN1888_c0_g1_i1:210-1181(-)